ncbi:GNAT family N-acetyltransferase [Nocardioides KLBMP 9356]|uniref:GNAT family N-acetyltransferase n=1 Tax=Nocardioides potassii TaxID=2911371 RepID=A0ABS9HFU5_9ACTN|nr:GNAT family N-acetyltransferase [Nocardioides potassii]MCF6380017.1 GNAT family N-acetyltransferase [Nocardioides potassii]
MDYDFAHLDLHDDSEEAVARRRGWVGAVLRGFRDPRPDDELVDKWVAHYRADEVDVSGAWLPEGEFGAGPMPVATYASLDKTLNAGRELLPLRMITDVTTSASHRRQGLLRRLIEDDLADAVATGVPMAALTASEATIYGRWGFGPATFRVGVEVDASPGFAFRDFTDPGRVELVEPADAWPHVKAVFDTFHRRQRGSVEWPAQYEDIHSGSYDFNDGGPNKKIRAAVHLDGTRQVDGFVIFKHGEDYSVRVEEMIALTTDAQLGLWSFLASMDRIKKVTFNLFHPDDPLPWALTDLNRVKTTEVEEFLWLRVLDVPRCLAARPWAADGTVVLGVDDPHGHAAGRFEVTTSDGVATVAATDRPAEVEVSAETLGSLYLSAVPALHLHRAGRVRGDDEAVRRFAAMADLSEAPYSLTGF